MQYMIRASVIKAHGSNYSDPISFKAGDVLEVGELDVEYEGWVRVTDPRGKEGWAPLAIIKKTVDRDVGIAVKDYSAKELTVDPGEELLIQYEHCQWCWVEHPIKGFGWVPKSCLAMKNKTLDSLR